MEIIRRAVWSISWRQIIFDRSIARLTPNEMTLSHFELATKSCGCVWRRTHVFLPSTRHLNCNKLKRYYVRAATATIKWMYLRLLPGRYRQQRKRETIIVIIVVVVVAVHENVNVNVPINQKEQHKPKIILSNEISCCQVASGWHSAWSDCASQCIFKNLMPTTRCEWWLMVSLRVADVQAKSARIIH